MPNILVIHSSAAGDAAISRVLVEETVGRLLDNYPDANVIRRDLGSEPVPHLTTATLAGVRGEPATAAERETRARKRGSDAAMGGGAVAAETATGRVEPFAGLRLLLSVYCRREGRGNGQRRRAIRERGHPSARRASAVHPSSPDRGPGSLWYAKIVGTGMRATS